MIFFAFSVVAFLWQLYLAPYKDPLMNRMNVFNEGVLLVISMCLPFFIEISLPKETYNAVGWVLVGLLGVTMLFNVGVLLTTKTYEIFVKCCKKKKKLSEEEIL